MGRSKVTPIQQPDDNTCGPSSLKIALKILGINKSLAELINICKTGKNGTSTKNLINAAISYNLSVLAVEYATLRHLKSALNYRSNQNRAVLVSYLYDLDEKGKPHPESGHWAVVASFMSDKGRIVLLDSATATKKSYQWTEFRKRWKDYDLKRKNVYKKGKKHTFKLVRSWQPQLMLVIAKNPDFLPKFKITTQRVY